MQDSSRFHNAKMLKCSSVDIFLSIVYQTKRSNAKFSILIENFAFEGVSLGEVLHSRNNCREPWSGDEGVEYIEYPTMEKRGLQNIITR